MAVRIYKIHVFDEVFFLLTIRMPSYQTFQGCDMLWGALTHKYAWHLNGVVLWGSVTNKIYIYTCRRYITSELGKVLS